VTQKEKECSFTFGFLCHGFSNYSTFNPRGSFTFLFCYRYNDKL